MSSRAAHDVTKPAAMTSSRASAWRLVGAALLGGAALSAGVALTATSAWLITRASQQPPVLTLTVAIVAVRFFGLARPVLRYTERLTAHDAALRLLTRMRVRVYEALVPLAGARLAQHRSGDVLSGVVADVDAVQDLHLRILQPAAVATLTSAVACGIAALVLPSAGLVLLVAVLVAGLLAPLLAARAARQADGLTAPLRADLAAAVADVLQAARDPLAADSLGPWLAEIRHKDAELRAVSRRVAVATGAGVALSVVATGAAVTVSTVLATSAASAGSIPAVSIAVLVLLPLAVVESLAPLPSAATLLARVRAARRRLAALMAETPLTTETLLPAALPPALPGGGYRLTLEDVTAHWARRSRAALSRLSLDIAAGSHVAVTGPSGCGKSTLVALLTRMLDPASGTVRLNGVDVQTLRGDDVRSVVGLVADDAHVFTSTLRENLRLARPGANDAALVQGLRRAQLGPWFDDLPRGLDTWLGEEGSLVSGGERRRLGVARALIADPPVLVLDEPAEGLDVETATVLIRDVLAAFAGRTVVLVTHRLEGLDLVDRVVHLPDLQAGLTTTVTVPASPVLPSSRTAADSRTSEAPAAATALAMLVPKEKS